MSPNCARAPHDCGRSGLPAPGRRSGAQAEQPAQAESDGIPSRGADALRPPPPGRFGGRVASGWLRGASGGLGPDCVRRAPGLSSSGRHLPLAHGAVGRTCGPGPRSPDPGHLSVACRQVTPVAPGRGFRTIPLTTCRPDTRGRTVTARGMSGAVTPARGRRVHGRPRLSGDRARHDMVGRVHRRLLSRAHRAASRLQGELSIMCLSACPFVGPVLGQRQSRPWIVSDELGALIETLLPEPGPKPAEGRARVPDRQALCGDPLRPAHRHPVGLPAQWIIATELAGRASQSRTSLRHSRRVPRVCSTTPLFGSGVDLLAPGHLRPPASGTARMPAEAPEADKPPSSAMRTLDLSRNPHSVPFTRASPPPAVS